MTISSNLNSVIEGLGNSLGGKIKTFAIFVKQKQNKLGPVLPCDSPLASLVCSDQS